MFTAYDTARAHNIARGITSPATPYRVAYAIGCAHVAAANRTTAPASGRSLSAWVLAAMLTASAWLACPAIAAAAVVGGAV